LTSGCFRFDRFVLDPENRLLRAGDAAVDLSGRYFDALALLVREQGRLVSKERFLDEVWQGAPVTDEALTQCIKTLRKALSDDAARPRFIETVPKHGYRFIAAVDRGEQAKPRPSFSWRRFISMGGAGALGGAGAGLIGGAFYGLIGAAQSGAISALLVLACESALVGLAAGAGVGFGIAMAGLFSDRFWQWSIAGGAAGGLTVGAFVKLLGLDAFEFLFGRSPGDITGAPEGLLLGAAVGLGGWLAHRGGAAPPRHVALAGLVAGAAGVTIALLGGHLMGGSLNLLAQSFPASHLRLDQIGAAFGERGFGPISEAATAGFEAALFGACMIGAFAIAERRNT
jgi:DNA-binding winged helix-turn-helix (wHTH) protein